MNSNKLVRDGTSEIPKEGNRIVIGTGSGNGNTFEDARALDWVQSMTLDSFTKGNVQLFCNLPSINVCEKRCQFIVCNFLGKRELNALPNTRALAINSMPEG